ncbi:uncharacterized protein LOC129602181 [Paramacrobiotus metropolitanus]|uniref:uncharacterized protein LOC129602181 n=1 Tax=Paramacrobiotus metropolitanus TaxID=2943436 RepID=UPI00244561F5|nr:uncharacterized protein LOC129602181 [Paramacrobiotus metropolitanus]XP_055357126.1 uncharacterized protein LOC129602181 [Paramacrobiotus metropolitanus]
MPSGMNQPNSVDVLGDDGMFRYGRVVDVADHGLYIDLLCPTRRREYFPFDRIFLPRKTNEADLARQYSKEFSTVSVNVLVPETPVGPWIWLPHPAVVVGGGRAQRHCGGVVVRGHRHDSGVECTEFVPMERIRWPDHAALPQAAAAVDKELTWHDHVHPGTFVEANVQLYDEVRSVPSEEVESFIQWWNRYGVDRYYSTVSVVNYVEGRLRYIYQPRACQYVYTGSGHRGFLKAIATFQEELDSMPKCPDEVLPVPDKMALPVKVFQEVFSHLETITQMELRAVCAAWDAMLDTAILRSCMMVLEYTFFKWRFDTFLPMATLHQRLQPGTQHVIIKHCGLRDNPTRNAAIAALMLMCDMIRYVAMQQHRTGIRLRSLHVSQFNFDLQINSAIQQPRQTDCVQHPTGLSTVTIVGTKDFYRLPDVVAVCSSLPCNTLLMTHCQIHLICSYGFLQQARILNVSIKIPTARLPMGDEFGCALWDVLDAALPAPSDQQLQELVGRLNGNTDAHQELKRVVCQLLCALQSVDPRLSAHYRGKKWCVDGLEGLQLGRLSRITRHFLVELHYDTTRKPSARV